VLGTFNLLKTALDSWRAAGAMGSARFLHVSTDEVYGSLAPTDPAFTENSPYRPNSPMPRARRRAITSSAPSSSPGACRR